jgi:hypothetical protein
MMMNKENVETMRTYENLLKKELYGLTKAEKKQKATLTKWWKSLDNEEAMQISLFLHNEWAKGGLN